MERYFLEPYRFIPPFRGYFWCRIAKRLIPRHLRRKMGVLRWHFEGTELFDQSIKQGAGILLAPNHCRWPDPLVMGVFGIQAREYLYYIASFHLFRQSRVMGWFLNRIGGYSIWREGADRESIRTTVQILAEAERPVVLFPEGTWFRQNDRVNPLQEGLSLITRQAARQSTRPIVVHPVGIKYWVLEDPIPALKKRLATLERRFGWLTQDDLSMIARVEKITEAILALKEIEYFGVTRTGSIAQRSSALISDLVGKLEMENLGKTFDGWPLERIRRLRQLLSRRLLDEKTEYSIRIRSQRELEQLLCCENVNAHSHEYLLEQPDLERLTESVERIDEMMKDELEVHVVPMGVTVSVGPAIDVRAFSEQRKGERGVDPLVTKLRSEIQKCVDYLRAKGPPPEWGCPRPPNLLAKPAVEVSVSPIATLPDGLGAAPDGLGIDASAARTVG